MERYSMFLDWENHYCKNGHTTQSNLQIQCNPYQVTHDIFHGLQQTIQKSTGNHKKPRIAKAILRKKNQAGGITFPDLRQYYKATVINTVRDRYQNRHTGPRNRIENPEVNPNAYGQLIFDKGGKNIKWEKESLFSKYCWETWTASCKAMKLEHTLHAKQ